MPCQVIACVVVIVRVLLLQVCQVKAEGQAQGEGRRRWSQKWSPRSCAHLTHRARKDAWRHRLSRRNLATRSDEVNETQANTKNKTAKTGSTAAITEQQRLNEIQSNRVQRPHRKHRKSTKSVDYGQVNTASQGTNTAKSRTRTKPQDDTKQLRETEC